MLLSKAPSCIHTTKVYSSCDLKCCNRQIGSRFMKGKKITMATLFLSVYRSTSRDVRDRLSIDKQRRKIIKTF